MMKFCYCALSANNYPGCTHSANQLVLGMHSPQIGEYDFNRLGVNTLPGTVLVSIIPVTELVRLAPAVNVLPLLHPIHVAKEWATLDLLSGGRVDFATRRGYDRAEYQPFGGIEVAVDKHRESCAGYGNPAARLICRYFIHFADRPEEEDLTIRSILFGGAKEIFDRPEDLEAAGIQAVILCSKVGNKPHGIVTNQMYKFKEYIAPNFKGTHQNLENLAN